MKLVTPSVDIDFCTDTPGGQVLRAGQQYVVPNGCHIQVATACRDTDASHPRISGLGAYTRHFHEQTYEDAIWYGEEPRPACKLVAWRGHGIGDQLVYAGLLRILATRHPGLEITWYVYPYLYDLLWQHVPDLPFRVAPEPVPWADWQAADYHLIGEELVESLQEPDQPDIWTAHLRHAGIAPDTVPPEKRRPLLPYGSNDVFAARAWLGLVAMDLSGGSVAGAAPCSRILWQLASSTPIRSYRPDLTHQALLALVEAIPAARVIVTGHPVHFDQYTIPEHPRIITTQDSDLAALRTTFALASCVDCIVCPDSVFGHLAGAAGTPCVSLWGSFLPRDRVATYPTHTPLTGAAPCAPCRSHEPAGPARGCPRRQMGETCSPYCEAMAQITPDQVVGAVTAQLSTQHSEPRTQN